MVLIAMMASQRGNQERSIANNTNNMYIIQINTTINHENEANNGEETNHSRQNRKHPMQLILNELTKIII